MSHEQTAEGLQEGAHATDASLIGALERTGPDGWRLEVRGRWVALTTSQLLNGPRSRAFTRIIFAEANVLLSIKATEWEAIVRNRRSRMQNGAGR